MKTTGSSHVCCGNRDIIKLEYIAHYRNEIHMHEHVYRDLHLSSTVKHNPGVETFVKFKVLDKVVVNKVKQQIIS